MLRGYIEDECYTDMPERRIIAACIEKKSATGIRRRGVLQGYTKERNHSSACRKEKCYRVTPKRSVTGIHQKRSVIRAHIDKEKCSNYTVKRAQAYACKDKV